MDLNKVTLIGRLPQDPELRNLPSGSVVASFAVATNRQWKDKNGERQKQTEYHRVVAWSKLAERVGQYLHKGSQVYIEGHLQTSDWTGKDNVKRYRTEVVAENMIMLGSKPLNTPNQGGESRIVTDSVVISGDAEEVIEEEVKVETIPF